MIATDIGNRLAEGANIFAGSQHPSENRGAKMRYDPVIPAIGFLLLAVMAGLYATGSDLYGRILAYWTFIPWDHPFIDAAAIPGWIACFRDHGLVVYTEASWGPCGLGPIIYSPLWLRVPFLPTDPAWTNWIGLSLASLFLLSLGFLPHAPRDRVLTILATFSCLPVFAVERGNVDLVIFLLAIAAGLCMTGNLSRRTLGYGLMLLGGLLKFYPLALLMLMLRERLTALLALGCAAVAITAGTALVLLDEIRRLTPVPAGAPFHNLWGARNLTTGFPTVLRAFLNAAGLSGPTADMLSPDRFVSVIVTALLLTSMLVIVRRLVRHDELRPGLTEMPDLAYQYLLIGAVLVVGCFFAGQSVAYRGVFLLLILPGVLALDQAQSIGGMRVVFKVTIGAMLCVLWQLTTRHVVTDIFGGSWFPVEGSIVGYLVWLIQELAWWWLVSVLVAILVRFVADAPVWSDLRLMLRPSHASEAD